MAFSLGKGAVKGIHAAVDKLYDRIKARYLGPNAKLSQDKKIYIGYRPHLTLQGLYNAAAGEERTRPDPDMVDSLARIAEGYLDASRAKTKAKVTSSVEQFLRDAQRKGVDTDLETVLGGHLADVWGQATHDITRIMDTEANHAKNMGTLDGITKVNAAAGVEDPVVYFITVRDKERCAECTRLHLLDDEVTPRCWYLSEVGHSYHHRGEPNPKMGGLHPHCRCSLATLMPGYGFIGGALKYLGKGYNELRKQRGAEVDESEDVDLSDLDEDKPLKKDENFSHLSTPKPPKTKAPKAPKVTAPAPEKNMAVVHNISSAGLHHADQLGGLAAPSIAVTHKDHGMEGFGEISMVAHPNLIDPKYNPVFDADVYSPRHPRASYKVNEKAATKLRAYLAPHAKLLEHTGAVYSMDDDIKAGGVERAVDSNGLKDVMGAAYLSERGHAIQTVMQPARLRHEFAGMPAMKEFVSKHGINHHFEFGDDYHKELSTATRASIDQFAKEHAKEDPDTAKELSEIYHSTVFGKDGSNVDFGRTRSLLEDAAKAGTQEVDKYAMRDSVHQKLKDLGVTEDQLKDWSKEKLLPMQGERHIVKYNPNTGNRRNLPYTLENILKEVTGSIRQGENTNYGLGTARAGGAKKFKSLEDLQNSRHKLVSPDEFKKTKEANNERFDALADKMNATSNQLAEAIGNSYKRGKSLSQELRNSGVGGVSHAHLKEAQDFARDLVNMPSEYFEAKPQRVVGINEFKGAVVPHDAHPSVLEVLAQHGIKHIERYTKHNEAERARAIHKIAHAQDLLLSEKDLDLAEFKK